MMKMKSVRVGSSLWLLAGVFTAFFAVSQGYGTGAPQQACAEARPRHRAMNSTELILPQTGDNPYSFSLEVDEYKPGQSVQVSIVASGNATFEGFFLQVRRARVDSTTNQTPVGTFTAPASDDGKLLQCSSTGDTVTHRSDSTKTQKTFTWNAPAQGVGDIQFTGTVLKEYEVFYSDMMSATLTEGTASQLSASLVLHTLALLIAIQCWF